LQEDGLMHKVSLFTVKPDLEEVAALDERFDAIVLNGVVEHMLPEERRNLFPTVMKLLRPKGHVVLYETPNRLWPAERHTTGLFGWSWLPANLALKYGKLRGVFNDSTDLPTMYRRGYGLTYWGLKDFLNTSDTKYEIRYKYVQSPGWRRAWIKCLTILFRAPHWAFDENLNVVITRT
jgi:hypothetical protein